jgi:hypothetical protein
MVLGFAKRYDKIKLIRTFSHNVSPDSDAALACTIAFGELCDDGSTEFLREQLSVAAHSFAARRSLGYILESGNKQCGDYCTSSA